MEVLRRVRRPPDDLARIVDAIRAAVVVGGAAPEGPEVHHRAMVPEERVIPSGSRAAHADDLTILVDGTRFAEIASEGPEVRHGAVFPQEGVSSDPDGSAAPPDNLTDIVHSESRACDVVRTGQETEIPHGILRRG